MANAFRRTPWQVVGLLFALAYGLGTAIFLGAGLFALRFFEVDIARNAVILFGSLAVVVFALLPLLLGIEDILDPRRFALYGMSNSRLATSIAVASLISVPAIVIAVIAFAQVSTWTRGPLPAGLAVASAFIIVLTCVLSARISTTLATFLLSTRRSRDLTTVIGVVLLVALVPAAALLATVDWTVDGGTTLSAIANVASWTPLGAAWGAPADAAAGSEGSAIAKLVLSIVWLSLLALVWRALVGAILVRPVRQAEARQYTGVGWFDRLGATPTGAIAARSATYWARDPRYLTNLVVIPVIPLVMIGALLVAGVPISWLALLPVPVMSLFLAWSVHNDVAFDNTAVWLHLVSSTSGLSDRVGRLVPALALGVPIVVLGSLLSIAVYGDWTELPALIGVSSSILLVGLGLSSVISAAFPYPAVRPNDSPFSQPQAGGSSPGLIQGLTFAGILILSAPAIAAAVLGFIYGGLFPLLALGIGLVVGLATLLLGIRAGARVFERRGPELLAAALRN